MRRTREEKAITLIALIITIVVLLILAVVAINAVTGDGIIQHAVNAKTSYENAQAKEQSMISYYETYLETEGQVGKWIQNKTKVTRVNEDGTVDELEVGDIVNYVATGTGYGDANEEEWAVLGAEDGKVLLVSSTNVTTIELSGANDYPNNTGINKLNEEGAKYDDGIGAVADSGRSIKVEDINRVTGYNPLKTGTGERYYNYTSKSDNKIVTQYLNRVTYTINEDGKVYFSSNLKSGLSPKEAKFQKFQHVDGTTLVKESQYTGAIGTAKSITVDSNFYGYYPVSLSLDSSTTGEVKGISAESNAYKLLFDDETGYWVGSSYVMASDTGVSFGMRFGGFGFLGGIGLWSSYDGDDEDTRGVRAVVTLKSDVQFTPDENSENTYNIS